MKIGKQGFLLGVGWSRELVTSTALDLILLLVRHIFDKSFIAQPYLSFLDFGIPRAKSACQLASALSPTGSFGFVFLCFAKSVNTCPIAFQFLTLCYLFSFCLSIYPYIVTLRLLERRIEHKVKEYSFNHI